MRYQIVILCLNIMVLVLIGVLMRNQTRKLKTLFATTLFAYFLAAILPYVLLSIPLKWAIFLYGIAILLALLIVDKTLYKQDLVEDEDSDRSDTVSGAETAASLEETFASPQEKSADDDLPAAIHTLIDDEMASEPVSQPTDEPADEPSFAVIEPDQDEPAENGFFAVTGPDQDEPAEKTPFAVIGPDQDEPAENGFFAVTDTEPIDVLEGIRGVISEPESGLFADIIEIPKAYRGDGDQGDEEELNAGRNITETDIEELIIAAFDAKGQDNLNQALNIFEQILNLNPPEEVAQLIRTDIEVLTAKLTAKRDGD